MKNLKLNKTKQKYKKIKMTSTHSKITKMLIKIKTENTII